VAVAGVTILFTHELRAVALTASAGERALNAASASLRAGEPARARHEALRARGRFVHVRGELRVLRSLLGVAAVVPAVDEQLDAIDALADAGGLAASAASRVAATGATLQADPHAAEEPLADLRRLRAALVAGHETLVAAGARVAALRHTGLAAPVAHAAGRARRRLRRGLAQATASLQVIDALLAFTGGDGAKRWLLLSQNPAEVRPTGGFIGTYGVLEARDGHLRLARYRSIESWYFRRRHAVVAAADAPRALRLGRHPIAQTIANANAAGDWPVAARLAARLWRRGGEPPVDGVISVTPDLVARALEVLGPVRVPGYAHPATSANVIALLDHHTHTGARARAIDWRPFGSLRAASERKRFVGLLAREIMRRATASGARRLALARAVGDGLAAREGMAWSADPTIQRVLREHGWDGAIAPARGDFFFDGEFAYAVKTARGLRRTFDHDVVLRADGSARVATTITVANTQSDGMDFNSYMTLYGPAGAVLHPDSDPPTGVEPQISGHPAAGWLRQVPKWGTTRLRVVWEVPRLLIRRAPGRFVYRLRWMRIAAHHGDVLRLRVTPPPGWRWAGKAPRRTRPLDRDVRAAWSLVR
jgi:hypothetical protein